MCEQTEINFKDGDVVWVKLRSYWWPGQVVGFNKLPQDIQSEFNDKALIAAVKFFQEECFEFVKNYQQIYKYDCRQKEDFIKKGLDKYRKKNKVGSNFMDKFPGDVVTAEVLTDGNPCIISDKKFSPKIKPDISKLFGRKKNGKDKRGHEEIIKDNHENMQKRIIYSRFRQKSDHEIRIRQQPKSLPVCTTTTSSFGGTYPCNMCSFIATRVNVIIYHLKSHRFNNETTVLKPKVKMGLLKNFEHTKSGTQKNRNVRKFEPHIDEEKTNLNLENCESINIEERSEKKKSYPELREKILADWNVDSDEDEPLYIEKSFHSDLAQDMSDKSLTDLEDPKNSYFLEGKPKDGAKSYEYMIDCTNLLKDTNKLLQEADSFQTLTVLHDLSDDSRKLDKFAFIEGKSEVMTKAEKNIDNLKCNKNIDIELSVSNTLKDQKSQLSCFDFNEDDIFGSNSLSVKKNPRGSGCKNMSLKKEIIKEFEKSQALKVESDKDVKSEKRNKTDVNASEENTVHGNEIEISKDMPLSFVSYHAGSDEGQISSGNVKKDTKVFKIHLGILDNMKNDMPEFSKLHFAENESLYSELNISVVKAESRTDLEKKNKQERLVEGKKNHAEIIHQEVVKFQEQREEIQNESEDNKEKNNEKLLLSEKKTNEECSLVVQKYNYMKEKNVSVIGNSEIIHSEESGEMTVSNELEYDVKSKPSPLDFMSKIQSHSKVFYKNDDIDTKNSYNEKAKSIKIHHGTFHSDQASCKKVACYHDEFEAHKPSETNELGDINSEITKIYSNCGYDYKPSQLSMQSFVNKQLNRNKISSESDNNEIKCENKGDGNDYKEKAESNQIIESYFQEMNNKLSPKKSASNIGKIKNESTVTMIEKCKPMNSTRDEIENFDYIQFDSFQDAFVQTLKIENETQKLEQKPFDSITPNIQCAIAYANRKTVTKNFSILDDIQSSIEVAGSDIEVEEKVDEIISSRNSSNIAQQTSDNPSSIKKSIDLNTKQCLKPISYINVESSNKSVNSSISILSVTENKISVPVKKREKPRIIENVALKKPMILKTKSIEKQSEKFLKRRMNENLKAGELIRVTNAKTMRLEDLASNKNKSVTQNDDQDMTFIKKEKKSLQKENSFNTVSISHTLNHQIIIDSAPKISEMQCIEKCIQQSSQDLVDMELDINSLPFVLSEDVLMSESIEQMSIVMSPTLSTSKDSITSSSYNIQSKELVPLENEKISVNQGLDMLKEISKTKKMYGSPAISKSKSKSKPTITSIKTIVPPLSATYEGFKVNKQNLKTSDDQTTFGKYVIVQTPDVINQQQAYDAERQISIPSKKSTVNAKIVQQGSKVVILTSPQSKEMLEQRMLSLNTVKKILNTGNLQKSVIFNQSQQVGESVQFQGFTGSNDIVASKAEKVGSIKTATNFMNQKQSGQHPVFTSKKLFTQMPGSIFKPTTLETIPQRILTKGGLFATFHTSFPKEKSKLNKNVVNPITQSLLGKSVVSSQGIVSKGTVLTPITGSQVKALAARNIKTNTLQYGASQHETQLVKDQKNSKLQSNVDSKTTSSNVAISSNSESKELTPKKSFQVLTQKQDLEQTVMQKKKKLLVSSLKNVNLSSKSNQKIVTEKSDEIEKFESIISDKVSFEKTKEDLKHVELVTIKNFYKESEIGLKKKNTILAPSTDSLSSFGTSICKASSTCLLEIDGKEKEDAPSHGVNIKEVLSSIQHDTRVDKRKTENKDVMQTYVLVSFDKQGQIIPLENSTLISLDETSDFDERKAFFIDSNSLTESSTMDNIILQINSGSSPNSLSIITEQPSGLVVSELVSPSETIQTSSRDILAAALANTDFQHEICAIESTISNSSDLINQTILQSTIIPPTEPISSPLVLETSFTLNQPIMTPLEISSSLCTTNKLTPSSSILNTSTSIKSPAVTSYQNASCVSDTNTSVVVTNNFVSNANQIIVSPPAEEHALISPEEQCLKKPELPENMKSLISEMISEPFTEVGHTDEALKLVSTGNEEQALQTIPIKEANNVADPINIVSTVKDNLSKSVIETSDVMIPDIAQKTLFQNDNTIISANGPMDEHFSRILELSRTSTYIHLDRLSSEQNASPSCTSNQSKVIIPSNSLKKKCQQMCSVSRKTSVQDENFCKKYRKTVESGRRLLIEAGLPSVQQPASEREKESETLKVISDKKSKDGKRGKRQKTLSNILKQFEQDKQMQVVTEKCSKMNFDKESKSHQGDRAQSYRQAVAFNQDDVQLYCQSSEMNHCQKSVTIPTSTIDFSELKGNNSTKESPILSNNYQNETFVSQILRISDESTPNILTQVSVELTHPDNDGIHVDEPSEESSFSPHNYQVDNTAKLIENIETDTEVSREGGLPLQSNHIASDDIRTSIHLANNFVLNEDETASYVPETPENQERDPDQESAISTSSYEILPCEELNIASPTVLQGIQPQSQHSNINRNDVPKITDASYNLNPDSMQTSNFKDETVLEHNVSTPFQMPISITNVREEVSQIYKPDGSLNRDQGQNYFSRYCDVSGSYYENMCEGSKLLTNSMGETTSKYYETTKLSQSFFSQDLRTSKYSISNASQSFLNPLSLKRDQQLQIDLLSNPDMKLEINRHLPDDVNKSSQSINSNVERNQSLCIEDSSKQFEKEKIVEAIPPYTNKYSLDYNTENSLLDSHKVEGNTFAEESSDR